jgi:hypothetical protein
MSRSVNLVIHMHLLYHSEELDHNRVLICCWAEQQEEKDVVVGSSCNCKVW